MRGFSLLIILLIISINGFCTKEIIPGSSAKGFIENKGQVRDQSGKPNSAVLYTKDFGGMKVQLRRDGFSYELYQINPKWVDPATIPYKVMTVSNQGDTAISWPGQSDAMQNKMYHYHRVDIRLEGCSPIVIITPEDKKTSKDRWLLGKSNPQTVEVSKYGQIRYAGIYPGIDMVCYANSANDGFKYDFILHPGADPSLIALSYSGAESLNLTPEGTLEIKTRFGSMTESIPFCYTENDAGIRTPIEGIHYQLNGNIIRFQGTVAGNNRMVIDPAVNLFWAVYFGGENSEVCTAAVTDVTGNNYICGYTYSYNNIATNGAYLDSLLFPKDGFLAKFSHAGQLIWSTYLNGVCAIDMDINLSNELIVAGDEGLVKFDSAGSFQWFVSDPVSKAALACDHFGNIVTVGDSVRKFSPLGTLLWKMKFGGSGTTIKDVGCDALGNIYFGGHTSDSTGIATPDSHLPTYNGTFPILTGWDYNYELIGGVRVGDGFIGKLDPDGQMVFGTYYGGKYYDIITRISVGDSGTFVVAGETNSQTGIATTETFQKGLNPQGSYGFMQITIGSVPCENGWPLFDTCIVGGYWPKPYDTRCQSTDAFIAKFSKNGVRLWGTYYGDNCSDYSTCINTTVNCDTITLSGITPGNKCIQYSSNCPPSRLASTYSYLKVSSPYTRFSGFIYTYVAQFDTSGIRIWGTYSPKENDIQAGNPGGFYVTEVNHFKDEVFVSGTNYDYFGVGYSPNAFVFAFNTLDIDTIFQPVHACECYGNTTVFRCGLLTNPLVNLDFQWTKNGQFLSGATDSVLIINNTSIADTGFYYCTITQGASYWKSDSINLSVREGPAFNRFSINNQTLHLPDARIFGDLDNSGDYDVIRQQHITYNDSLTFVRNDSIPYLYHEVSLIDLINDNQFFVFSHDPRAYYYGSTRKSKLIKTQGGQISLYENTLLDPVSIWADFDNDGKPEGFKTVTNYSGNGYTDFYLVEYDNDTIYERWFGSGPWRLEANCVQRTCVADYDNDGDIDILLTGTSFSGCGWNNSTTILVNSNNSFEAIPINDILPYRDGYAQWFDADADGDMDVISDHTLLFTDLPVKRAIYFFENNSGTLTLAFADTLIITNDDNQPKPKIFDFDNDGFPDFVVKNLIFKKPDTNYVLVPSSYGIAHSGLTENAKAIGDVDNDGDIDILGENSLFINDVCNPPNTPPTAPSGISILVSNDTVHFIWQRATDQQTPQMGLTYNLRVGTSPGGNQIMSSLSAPSGWRKVVTMGNAFQNTGWWLHNLQPGTYFWSVQAIDNSFAGGPFAPEKSFVIPLTSLPVPQVNDTFSCQPGVVVLTATGAGPGQTYKWFDDPCSAYSIGSGSPFTTPFLNQSDTFYVAIDSAGWQSIRKKVVVSVFAATVAGEVTGGGTIFFGMGATLNLEGNTGSVLKWQKRWNGGEWQDIPETGTSYNEVPDTTGTWEYRTEVRSGSCAILFSAFATVIVQPVSRTVNLTLFLEGLFNPATNQMNKARDENGDKYPGTIADIIQIHLAKSTTPYSFYYSVNGADLNQDGTCTITVPRAGFFYLVVRHRNSIETWSAAPVSLLTDNISYDFSTSASMAYGDNLKEISGKWVIWCGDVNQDRLVDLGDMIDVDNDVSAFVTGYVVTDVNGDGIVDSDDMLLIIQNSDNFISSFFP